MKLNSKTVIAVAAAVVVAILLYALYLQYAITLSPGYGQVDWLFALALAIVMTFWIANSVYYAITLINSSRYAIRTPIPLHTRPVVAVFITSFNEPGQVLEPTIQKAVAMKYPHKEIFLLDDSTDEKMRRDAHALALKYRLKYVHRKNRRGFKAGAINDALKTLGKDRKYMLLLDADQQAHADILDEVIPFLEEDPKLAFVQLPITYRNRNLNNITRAAFAEMRHYYSYIAEGRDVSNSMLSGGTNVVKRISALREVGGMDESSITEDTATSFRLHLKGYTSYFHSKVLVEGKGPETISSYFSQQMRWAHGNVSVLPKVLGELVKNPRALSIMQWLGYLVITTWNLVGFMYLGGTIIVLSYLLFDAVSIIHSYQLYAGVVFFQFAAVTGLIYGGMKSRGVRVIETWLMLSLYLLLFPVFIAASASALLGKKLPFVVTPKLEKISKQPLAFFWPQITIAALLLASLVIGVFKFLGGYNEVILGSVAWAGFLLAQFLTLPAFIETKSG